MKRLTARLAALLFGLLVGVAALEIGLRVIGWSAPRLTTHDPNRGKAYRPGIRWHQAEEGEADIIINRWGFRDREWTLVKPPGTVRVALLGDSFVDGLQVPIDSTWAREAERRLNACHAFGDSTVEVMNFGVSGYGTAQELQTLRHDVHRFAPDIVVLSFLPGNDVRDNGVRLRRDPGRPYFTCHDDSLILDRTFQSSHGRMPEGVRSTGLFLLDRSRVAQAVYRMRLRSRERAQLQSIHERTDILGDAPHQELGLDNMVFRLPEHPAWIEAWQVTDALINAMNLESTARGASFLAVTISSSIQVHPDRAVREAFMTTLGVDSLSYPEERVAALGRAEGFPVLVLAPRMLAFAESRHAWLHGFANTRPGYGHWNGLGHRLAGACLAEALAAGFGRRACPAE
ncbi:MAG: SGNH/GDSL hydrolase family protein [Candidatus Eisenbacteria bacterium]|nr:SGNH/GDSL hydrolase family protein [Candidatus Eisenbacteria bacterium]